MATPQTAKKHDDDTKQASPHTPPAQNGNTAHAAAPAPAKKGEDRFTKIETERYMYNPNKGCDTRLVGYLLNLLPMPPMMMGGEEKDWNCFLFRITEPCKVIDREGKVITVPEGSEVLSPATHQLTQFMERVSSRPDLCFEVRVTPKSKLEIGKGQTMWLYDLGINMGDPKPRKAFGPAAMLGGPPALTGGQVTAEQVGGPGADNIPF
jgi:hypothetical protein